MKFVKLIIKSFEFIFSVMPIHESIIYAPPPQSKFLRRDSKISSSKPVMKMIAWGGANLVSIAVASFCFLNVLNPK